MNIQLFSLQTVLIIIAWLVIGAIFDFIKEILILGAKYACALPGKLRNAAHIAKSNFIQNSFSNKLIRLGFTAIELLFTLLEKTIWGSFLSFIYTCAIVFFIPNLLVKVILKIFFHKKLALEGFFDGILTTTLKTQGENGDNTISVYVGGNFEGNLTIGDVAGRDTHKPASDNKDEIYVDLKKALKEIGKEYFKISIGHPKLISKGIESPFVVHLYFEELANSVKMKIKEIVGENYTEQIYDTELKFGQVVKIKLFSPDITFPEAIAKRLDSSNNSVTFLGKPLETCQPREHKVVLSILDNKTGIEYQSETFSVKVVDFAFDHVSRPSLSRVSTIVLGIGSFIMFVLTLLEQIDKTIGLTSGTAAGILAAVVYTNFYNLYQRIRPTP